MGNDPWKHRSKGMRCKTCMWFAGKANGEHEAPTITAQREKELYQDLLGFDLCDDGFVRHNGHILFRAVATDKGETYKPLTIMKVPSLKKKIGRCRRHAPTMNGYPVVFEDDWCGDHKLNEEAL